MRRFLKNFFEFPAAALPTFIVFGLVLLYALVDIPFGVTVGLAIVVTIVINAVNAVIPERLDRYESLFPILATAFVSLILAEAARFLSSTSTVDLLNGLTVELYGAIFLLVIVSLYLEQDWERDEVDLSADIAELKAEIQRLRTAIEASEQP
ncbi:MAG: hypothetical protein GYB68_15770 [Chloroflexi bacterium]|nr:hypothetical protein [Chloroflexota bacterium]